MTLPSFKPLSLYLSRSPLSKTSKQVFFNPINIFVTFTHSIYCFIIYFFRLTSKFYSCATKEDIRRIKRHDGDIKVKKLDPSKFVEMLASIMAEDAANRGEISIEERMALAKQA